MSIEAALFGTLGRDAESKTSKSGKAYLRLNVAVSEGETTTWVSVMAFDPKAIERADAFVKGSRVYVEGKLSQTEWTGNDGEQRHGLSVMSWHCRLAKIGRAKTYRAKKREQKQSLANVSNDAAQSSGTPFSDEIPFAPEWRA